MSFVLVDEAFALLGEVVEARGQSGAVWSGRLIGISESPSLIIDEPGGRVVVGVGALVGLSPPVAPAMPLLWEGDQA